MKIRKDLIPTDKLSEISIRQIHEIVQFLFEPLKVNLTDIELPKYVSTMSLEELRNRTFEGRLISISNGKVLFEPNKNEWDKIELFDKILDIQDLLFGLKHKQQDFIKVENRTNRPKLKKEIIELFNRIFEGTTKKEHFQERSRTKKLIIDKINDTDKKGWEYAFKSKEDFDLFTMILTCFFEHKDYEIPKESILLKRNCKTKIGRTLGDIHKELSEKPLKSDNAFFKIIRCLSHFKDETDLYKVLTR